MISINFQLKVDWKKFLFFSFIYFNILFINLYSANDIIIDFIAT